MDLSPPFFPACESNLTPYLASRDIVLSLCSCRSVLALSGSPISWQVARAVVVAMNPAFAPTTAAARRGLLIAFTRRGCLLTAVADVVALLSSSKTASWRLLILSPLALPRLALPRADRGAGLQHHSVLGFGRIEQRAALYLYGYRFYRPLDHFDRTVSLRFKRGLDVLDHGLKLLVRQALDHIALLDLVLARAQLRQNLQVRGRLCSAHTFNRLRAAVPEVSEQGRNKLAIQLLTVTRADRTAGRVS